VLYLIVLGALIVLIGGIWAVSGAPAAGWVLAATVVVGLALPVARILLRRGGPDDKFPWE
jgi:membrane protein implicated in regulation of membrane protease activity